MIPETQSRRSQRAMASGPVMARRIAEQPAAARRRAGPMADDREAISCLAKGARNGGSSAEPVDGAERIERRW
ncbi:hypothetical protein Syun_020124 [Stephania yunnanensis]|uniref:Uncharacterized protein n=1 Tax=Stephania yunnanensis TaxID=152371 RepID=A0AAP0IEM4_9MAGN